MNLGADHVLFFDGIRFAVQGADLAFERLKETLRQLATSRAIDFEPLTVSAILDAWSVIDSIDRVRTLMLKAPIARNESETVRFLQYTRAVRDLRNHAQHMLGKLPKLAAAGDPIWGVLSWVTWDGEECYACSLQAGTVFARSSGTVRVHGIFPGGHRHEPIKLMAVGKSVMLDEAIVALKAVVASFEAHIAEQFRTGAPAGAHTSPDMLTVMELNVDELKKEWQAASGGAIPEE